MLNQDADEGLQLFGRGAIGFRKVKSQKSKNPPYEKRVGWAPSSVGDIRVVSADILVCVAFRYWI